MSNAIYNDEQKELLIKSLQATIDDCKKKIANATSLIKQIQGSENPLTADTKRPARRTKEGGIDWFSKITHVLNIAGKPLTSREILDLIYVEYPDFIKDNSHMGSLSSALRTRADNNELIKTKQTGEFARFALNEEDEIF